MCVLRGGGFEGGRKFSGWWGTQHGGQFEGGNNEPSLG